jgi:hypothetical protein
MTISRDLSVFHPRRAARSAMMALVFACAACSGAPDAGNENARGDPANAIAANYAEASPNIPDAPIGVSNSATIGGDGSEIRLDPLAPVDLADASLPGELGCTFSSPGLSPGVFVPLLVAKGNVASRDAAIGIVKVAGYVERVAARGGFDAMAKGTTFTGKGKTIGIALTGPATGGGESPSRPATLTYDRADGAKRSFAGTWQCGP